MFDCKDIQVQADFPSYFEETAVEEAPKFNGNVSGQRFFMKRRIFRLKNPIETINQYKKRIFRICKEKKEFTESVLVKTQDHPISISGNRCVSVDISYKKPMISTRFGMSFTSINKHQRLLPKISKDSRKPPDFTFIHSRPINC